MSERCHVVGCRESCWAGTELCLKHYEQRERILNWLHPTPPGPVEIRRHSQTPIRSDLRRWPRALTIVDQQPPKKHDTRSRS